MKKVLKCIMLIDDNPDHNFFNERIIRKVDVTNIITRESGREALDYLKSKKEPCCSLIFLDVNMPGMNGWEFLEKYEHLDKELQDQALIIMLTTSENPDDRAKAKTYTIVSDFLTKPLTIDIMKAIIAKHF